MRTPRSYACLKSARRLIRSPGVSRWLLTTGLGGRAAESLRGNRQPLPPLGAPALEHQTAILPLHPHEKAVRATPMTIVGLKGPFHAINPEAGQGRTPAAGHHIFRARELLILANACEGCQRKHPDSRRALPRPAVARCAESHGRGTVLQSRLPPATERFRGRKWMNLVSSQRFPHLWKKLWKILGIQPLTSGEPCKIGPWLAVGDPESPRNGASWGNSGKP